MPVCLQCPNTIPKDARADAVYCSTSCKLKAQRLRKKAASTQPVSPTIIVRVEPHTTAQPEATPLAPAEHATAGAVMPSAPSNGPAQDPSSPTESHAPVESSSDDTKEDFQPATFAPSIDSVPIPQAAAPQVATATTAKVSLPQPILAAAPQVTPKPTEPYLPASQSAPESGWPGIVTKAVELIKTLSEYKQRAEQEAAARRAKESPEERQRREAEEARATRRRKKFDQFV